MTECVKHILLAKFKDTVTPEMQKDMITRYTLLPNTISTMKGFEWYFCSYIPSLHVLVELRMCHIMLWGEEFVYLCACGCSGKKNLIKLLTEFHILSFFLPSSRSSRVSQSWVYGSLVCSKCFICPFSSIAVLVTNCPPFLSTIPGILLRSFPE